MFLSSRIVSLIGAFGIFVASLMTWYWSEVELRRTENAWQGEESLIAVILMLITMVVLAGGWAWRSGWLAMGVIELLLGIGCFGLIVLSILHNREPVIVYGRTYPTGIGAGAWVGLFSSVVMIVGSILYLCSGGPAVFFGEEEFLEEQEFEYEEPEPLPHRRRRRQPEWDDRDESEDRPRYPRRRRPPRPLRRPPRRRPLDD